MSGGQQSSFKIVSRAARLLTPCVPPVCMGNENNRMRPKMTFNIYNMFRFKLFSGVFTAVSWFLTFQRLPATIYYNIIHHAQSKSPSKTRFRVSKLSVYASIIYYYYNIHNILWCWNQGWGGVVAIAEISRESMFLVFHMRVLWGILVKPLMYNKLSDLSPKLGSTMNRRENYKQDFVT